jgi:uracil-DNA glycosylase
MTNPFPQFPATDHAGIAIIGEFPYADWAMRLMEKCLGTAGILKPFCYVDTVLRANPPKGRFQLEDKEIVAECALRLRTDLQCQSPKVVIACGAATLKTLCPGYPADIAKMRGLPIAHPDNYTIIPTLFTPFLRGAEMAQVPLLIHDLKKAKRFSLGQIRRPQRKVTIIYGEESPELIAELLAALGPVVVFDIETTRRQELLCIGFADSPNSSLVIWLDKSTLSPQALENNFKLAKMLMAGNHVKVGQNIYRFDLPLLRRYGFELNNVDTDTMVMWHDCFPLFRKSLANLASYYTDEPYWKELLGSFAGEDDDKMVWDGTMSRPLAEMNGRDCMITMECYQGLTETGKSLSVEAITKHDMKCASIARDMTENGLPVDKVRIKDEAERRKVEIEEATTRLNATAIAAGWVPPAAKKATKKNPNPVAGVFNCKSTKAVRAFITDVLKLTLPHNKHGKVTSDAMALLEMSRVKKQPLLRDIVLLSKKRTRAAFFKLKLAKGRFHAGINVTATKSGRWGGESSLTGGKSLMNFPKEARHIFRNDPGFHCLQIDKKQAEACITASKAFVETGDDSYRHLIATVDKTHLFLGRKLCEQKIFSIDPAEFSDKNEIEYLISKRGVHGFSYGLGPLAFCRKLAKDTDGNIVIPVAIGKAVQSIWFGVVPAIPKWQHATMAWVRNNPELVNPFGRKIWLYAVKGAQGEGGENLPLAWYPQSTCTDDLTHGVVRLHEAKLPFSYHMYTYDGLWMMVDKQSWCPELCQKLHETMEQPFTVESYDKERRVELTIGIEVKIGDDFGKGLEKVK